MDGNVRSSCQDFAVNQSMKLGMDLHRGGRIAEAREQFRRAAAEEPRNVEAHHLLGVTFHQLGDASTAVEHYDRALDLNPTASIVHSNRAESLRALGRLEDAEAAARTAVSLDGGNASALHNLGVILLRLRRHEDAEAVLRSALAIRSAAATHAALADALRHGGRLRAAVEQYEFALGLNERLVSARGNLALLYEQFGRFEEALHHAKTAVEIAPHDAAAHGRLGRVLLEMGRTNDAMESFAAALEIDPNDAELCLRNGRGWLRLGNLQEAVRWAERALQLDPELTEARCLGAAVQLEAGDPESAAATLQAVVAEHPDCREAAAGLAKALLEQGDADGAVLLLKTAVERDSQSAGMHAALGDVLMNAGDLEGAVASFLQAIRANPRCVRAFAGLGTTLRGKTDEETVQRIERMIGASWMTNGRNAALHFALAQIYDGRGEYSRAGDELRSANELQKREFAERDRRYDASAHRRYVDRLCELFDAEYFRRVAGWGDSSTRPVFIVGMPRSGTTLTEQILASHPDVHGAGERRFAQLSFQAAGLKPSTDLAPTTRANSVRTAAAWHLEQLKRLDGGASARVIDKMPDNYQILGWIATLFPNAKIVHCRRDVRDTALSCWMTNFSRINWANDLADLAERINDYQRVMDHYRRVLPTPILEIDYEETVTDQLGATRRLLDWIGLPWNDACLDFHKTDRLVRTASVAQVRQPIYTRSVARWKRYEAHLEPFLARVHAD
jgi:tetratricopeptide (TPR) repeat protein